jgi:hypothetical protein
MNDPPRDAGEELGVRFTLSPEEHAEAIGNLLALRRLASELADVFAGFSPSGKRGEAARGARTMVDSLDRVLHILESAAGQRPTD